MDRVDLAIHRVSEQNHDSNYRRNRTNGKEVVKQLQTAGLDVDEVLELDRSVASGAGGGSSVSNTVLEITKQSPIRFEQHRCRPYR